MTHKTSIDLKELNKFSKEVEEWWNPDGEFKTLHDINPTRMEYISNKIMQHYQVANFKNLKILDVGCGGGLISVPLHKLGAKVTGLDANSQNIESCIKYAKNNNLDLRFVNETIEEHKEDYDIIICLEVIEHVLNPQEFVHNLTRLVRKNGMIILSTINRTIKSYFQTILMAEYFLRWVPYGTHEFSKFIKPSDLKKMLVGSNFYIKELSGLKLDIINNRWYTTNLDIDVNYFACITKIP